MYSLSSILPFEMNEIQTFVYFGIYCDYEFNFKLGSHPYIIRSSLSVEIVYGFTTGLPETLSIIPVLF